jgi:hypothetical protein
VALAVEHQRKKALQQGERFKERDRFTEKEAMTIEIATVGNRFRHDQGQHRDAGGAVGAAAASDSPCRHCRGDDT